MAIGQQQISRNFRLGKPGFVYVWYASRNLWTFQTFRAH